MPIHHAVLALLADGPNHGYELKASFEHAVGKQWGALNIGHLYQVLERLSRDGLVTSHREPQPVKPDRVVYELTDDGRTELHRWLAEPSQRQGGYRDDFFLKLMAAARSGDSHVVQGVLSRQRHHLLHELRNLAELRRQPDTDPIVALLITAAELHVRADLGLLDAADDRLSEGPLTAAREAAADTRERPTQSQSQETAPPPSSAIL